MGHTTRGALREPRAVGIIGCGRMGREMAGHLVDAGWDVLGTDPVPEALEGAVARGVRGVGDPAELAGASDVVLVAVVDDEQVRDVLAGPGRVLEHARPGTIVAICSTVRPDTCVVLAEQGRSHDVAVIDVALVGGERGAELASLTLMCGGDGAAVRRAQPVFAAIATTVCHVGDVGSGQVAKTANNVLMWAALRADVEVLRLARAHGIEPGLLRGILRLGTGGNCALEQWGSHRLRWPTKDLVTAAEMARDAGLDLPLVERLRPLLEELTVDDLEALR